VCAFVIIARDRGVFKESSRADLARRNLQSDIADLYGRSIHCVVLNSDILREIVNY
jgi:hypothetical protein